VPNGNFAECRAWHSAKPPPIVAPRGSFAECSCQHSANCQDFAECQGFSTRQSDFSANPVKATLPSVFPYALGKVANFLLFYFSLFFDTNTTKIYLNTWILQAVIITNI
jgi:hypothetical protein